MKMNTLSIADLSAKIIDEAPKKVDFTTNTRNLTFNPDGSLVLNGHGVAKPTDHFLRQVGEFAGIPAAYVDRMREKGPDGLFAHNVNQWFQKLSAPRMIRTIQNGEFTARAFVSDKFRALDYVDVAGFVLPTLQRIGAYVIDAQITETRLYIQAISKNIRGTVTGIPGHQFVHREGDEVVAAIHISDSEVGAGSFRVDFGTFIERCTNVGILGQSIRKHHVGRRGFGDGAFEDDGVREFFRSETVKMDNDTFWMKVQDVVNGTLTQERLDDAIALMNKASAIELPEAPTAIMKVTQAKYGLGDSERERMLAHLAKGGDLSLYGLHNAMTRTAQDIPDYDRAVEMERFGGRILELGPAFVKEIAAAASLSEN